MATIQPDNITVPTGTAYAYLGRFADGPPPASLTLTPPTPASGVVGVASGVFAIGFGPGPTPEGPVTASISVTNASSSVGSLAVPGNFTITPAAEGTCTVNVSASGFVSPSGVSYTATVSGGGGGGSTPIQDVLALPAPGHIGFLGSSTVLDAVGPNAEAQFMMPAVLGAWGSAALVLIKDGATVIDAYYCVHGGGHNDSGYDGVLMWRASTQTWTEVLQWAHLWPRLGPDFDMLHGEEWADGRVVSDHAYTSLHALHSDEPGGPAFVKLRGAAVGSPAIGVAQSHIFPIGAAHWSRYSNREPAKIVNSGVSPVVGKDTLRQVWRVFPGNNYANWYELPYGEGVPRIWEVKTQALRPDSFANVAGLYDPVRDLYIGGNMMSPSSQMRALPASNPTGAWTALTFTGDALPTGLISTPWIHRTATDTFVFVDTSTSSPTHLFEITPPPSNPLSSPWTVVRRAFVGSSVYTHKTTDRAVYNRWQYLPGADALIVCPRAESPIEVWKL